MSNRSRLPTLDAHVHIKHVHGVTDLAAAGAALAMSLSLDEAAQAAGRRDSLVLWGVGCHPGNVSAQEGYDRRAFESLIEHTAVVGEIGLDRRSDVPFETQLRIFREILELVMDSPRIVSIHSNHATREVLDELQRKPILVPVLHWWNGSDSRTKAAVGIGCYFSLNATISGYSKFPSFVPIERILVETDQDYDEPLTSIPKRIRETEGILSTKYAQEPESLRRIIWRNLGTIAEKTGTGSLMPEPMIQIASAR